MQLLADIDLVQRDSKEGFLSSELARLANFDPIHAWDEILEFLPSEMPISVAQYTCWHALVRQQMNISEDPSERSSVQSVDIQHARRCFENIKTVHSGLDGMFPKIRLMDRYDITAKTKAQRLTSSSIIHAQKSSSENSGVFSRGADRSRATESIRTGGG
jgi:hypothetical protein